MRLCIFRTNNGRGWGIKTLDMIRKNSFVIEYIGEIITNEEAENRGVKYGRHLNQFFHLLFTAELIH